LTLSSATGTGNAKIGATDDGVNDVSSAMEYWNGSAWVAYTTGSVVNIPATADLLVRVALFDQENYEGPETFTLTVTDANGRLRGAGTATIKDDGTGNIYMGDLQQMVQQLMQLP
jgi:hypothetical protein